jgi:hypothetical protein
VGIRANRTKRLREKLVRYLTKHGPKSSRELLDYYNTATRQGTTMNTLTNVLSKDPRFEVIQTIQVSQSTSGRYSMLVWGVIPPKEEE